MRLGGLLVEGRGIGKGGDVEISVVHDAAGGDCPIAVRKSLYEPSVFSAKAVEVAEELELCVAEYYETCAF